MSGPTETNPSAAATAIYDKAETLSRLDGDEELCDEILRLFLGDAPNQIQALASAIEEGNFEKARRASHSIKGASSNVGAKRLSKVAGQLESAAKDGRKDDLKPLQEKLREEFKALRDLVEPKTAG